MRNKIVPVDRFRKNFDSRYTYLDRNMLMGVHDSYFLDGFDVDDFNYSPTGVVVNVSATNGASVTMPDGAIWGYYFASGVAIVTGKIKAFKFNGWYSCLWASIITDN